MAREVVTGYCWPNRRNGGAGRPAPFVGGWTSGRVEVARVGATRQVVFSDDAVAAGEHETPKDAASKGCGWPVALTLDVDPSWRSGYYEVVMEIEVGDKVRRDYAFFVVRPRPVPALCWPWPPTPGTPTTTLAGRISTPAAPMWPCGDPCRPATSSSRRARAAGSPGPGRPIPRTPPMSAISSSITCRAMPVRPAGPTGRCPSLRGPSVRASRSAFHQRRPRDAPRGAGRRQPVPVGRPRRVLVTRHARHGRSLHRAGRQRGVLLGQHVAVAGAH